MPDQPITEQLRRSLEAAVRNATRRARAGDPGHQVQLLSECMDSVVEAIQSLEASLRPGGDAVRPGQE
jgi:hypothetical protein